MRLESRTKMFALLVALTLFAGCDDNNEHRDAGPDSGREDGGPSVGDGGAARSVAALLASDPSYTMLVAAATRAGLADTLAGAGPVTVFAPTNAAFAASGISSADIDAMPIDQLKTTLAYHVVAGKTIEPAQLTNGPILTAADLSAIVGQDSGVTLNGGDSVTGGANVTTPGTVASNGIYYPIDRVLLPPNLLAMATYVGLTSFTSAVNGANLGTELSKPGPYTVFAPNNDAFAALSPAPTGAALQTTLLYHVTAQRLTAADIGALPTPAIDMATKNTWGNPISAIVNTNGVNDAKFVLTDLYATNGVMHVIDTVLMPPNIVQMAGYAGLTDLLTAVQNAAPLSDGTTLPTLLSGTGPFTLFAPNNDAFQAASSTTSSLSADQLRDVLLYHVLSPTLYGTPVLATDLPAPPGGQVQTALGLPANVNTAVQPPTIEGAPILVPDVNATNGVVHVIGAVLVPPGT